MVSEKLSRWALKEIARRNITQAELGKALGLKPPAICQRFGGRNNWQLDDLPRVAKFFDLSTCELVKQLKI